MTTHRQPAEPWPIRCAEAGWIPDRLLRFQIARLLRQRLRHCHADAQRGVTDATLRQQVEWAPITLATEAANQQHYEVPTTFFQRVLGRHLKYSCGLWSDSQTSLDDSEQAMLDLTIERAGLADGQRILELGCGWGSLSLEMARRFPHAEIVAVSNSATQRQTIEDRCRQAGWNHLRVVTADVGQLQFPTFERFDRIVSVEMMEHVRNHRLLFERLRSWLDPAGTLFVHIFCHQRYSYLFEDQGRSDWMSRHFFTGGMMPSFAWLTQFSSSFETHATWPVNGLHYQRTCEAWLQRLDEQRDVIEADFRRDLDRRAARVQVQRWRMFFMACAELFGYAKGNEWFVGHYRLTPTR